MCHLCLFLNYIYMGHFCQYWDKILLTFLLSRVIVIMKLKQIKKKPASKRIEYWPLCTNVLHIYVEGCTNPGYFKKRTV